MYIAKKLRKENITAYIIYMFQVEDMLRACQLDMEQVERSYLARFGYEETLKAFDASLKRLALDYLDLYLKLNLVK